MFFIFKSNLCWDRATDREIHINIRFGGDILEVDGGVVFVLGFTEIECELVVYGEVVVAALVDRVAEVMILSVALLAVVPRHPLGGAEAVASPVFTLRALPVTLALAAVPAVHGVSVVAGAAAVAVFALGVVLAGLLALPGGGGAADTVAVTLAGRAGGEVPLLLLLTAGVGGGPVPRPRPRQAGVLAGPGQRPRDSALLAGTQSIVLPSVAPTTGRVAVTVGAGVVAATQVGQARVRLRRAVIEVSGPVHALAVREGGQVGVPVHTHLHVVAPHTHRTRTVGAGLPGRAGHRAARLGVLLAASLLAVVAARHRTLFPPALFLGVPGTFVSTAATIAGVKVGAELLGLTVQALGGVSDDHHFELRTFL